jgi:hypothetical protein
MSAANAAVVADHTPLASFAIATAVMPDIPSNRNSTFCAFGIIKWNDTVPSPCTSADFPLCAAATPQKTPNATPTTNTKKFRIFTSPQLF